MRWLATCFCPWWRRFLGNMCYHYVTGISGALEGHLDWPLPGWPLPGWPLPFWKLGLTRIRYMWAIDSWLSKSKNWCWPLIGGSKKSQNWFWPIIGVFKKSKNLLTCLVCCKFFHENQQVFLKRKTGTKRVCDAGSIEELEPEVLWS